MSTISPAAEQTKLSQQAEINARVTAWTTPELRLYQSAFSPGPDSVLADFDAAEADFDGYAAESLATFTPAGPDQDGGQTSPSNAAVFQKTAGAATNTIGGAYLVGDPAGTPDLVEYFVFTPPLPMSITGAMIVAILFARNPQPDVLSVQN